MTPTGSSGLTEPTPAGTPEKAEIHVYYDPTSTDGTASKVISCMFRPTQLSFSKSASWNPPVADDSGGGQSGKKKETATQKGQNVPTVEFSGGQAASITLDLLFNTTDTGEDVRTYTDELVNLTLLQTTGGVKPPPVCRFVWGKIRSFLAYVGSVTITFKMFLSDGTPVRADAKVSLTQYKDDGVFKKQNPTSFSEPRKMWVVTEGERLEWIAYKEYGNSSYWRHIARTNGILDPLDVRPGQVLKLTPLPSGQS
jgi:hypothetical protein